jgi:2Fe-2S ferredoxin
MPSVRLLPYNATFEAEEGESLLWQILEHGYHVEHECEGCCSCATCRIIVLEGEENLSEMEEDERDRLSTAENVTPPTRLSCQTKPQGDCTVQVVNYDFDRSSALKR